MVKIARYLVVTYNAYWNEDGRYTTDSLGETIQLASKAHWALVEDRETGNITRYLKGGILR